MRTALILTRSGGLLEGLRRSLKDAGFAVEASSTSEELWRALNAVENIAAGLVEARRESFASLLKPMVRIRPDLPVYLIDSSAVFCRYPMRSNQPDIVAALREAGIKVPERLLMTTSGAPSAAGGSAFLI
jgi:hypothetical protein